MKRWMAALFLVVMVFSLPALAEPGSGGGLFARAVREYQSGDYDAAIMLNERLLNEQGLESPAVYFNLGNSYFKKGALGRAILNYLRAQRLAPRDADIKANLSFARQEVEQYESTKASPVHRRWLGLFSSLTAGELKWLAAVVFMLTGFICLGGLYSGLPAKRVLLFTGVSLAVTGYIVVALIVNYLDNLHRAVVLTSTEALFEPSSQATVYFKLSEGTELKVLRHKDSWVKVQRPDGREAWVTDKTVGEL